MFHFRFKLQDGAHVPRLCGWRGRHLRRWVHQEAPQATLPAQWHCEYSSLYDLWYMEEEHLINLIWSLCGPYDAQKQKRKVF